MGLGVPLNRVRAACWWTATTRQGVLPRIPGRDFLASTTWISVAELKNLQLGLWPRLVNQVKWGLSGATEPCEACVRDHLADP